MKNIIVTGSLAFDFIMDFPETFAQNIMPDKLHILSVSFLANKFSKSYGGVAGNIGYNFGLLKQKTTIFASAGENDFESYLKHLQKAGVYTEDITIVKDEFTANFFVITDKNDCQIAGFYPGAMSQDATLSLLSLKNNIANKFLVVAPTMPEAMERFVNEAKKLRIPYLYDPAQQIPRLSEEQLQNGINGAEIIIGNDYEIALIINKTSLNKKDLIKHGKTLVTTLGEKGSLIETEKHTISIGVAKPKEVVDPTGAGDGYIAGFLTGYLRKLPLKTCGQMGATAASYAIECYGPQNHKFTFDEFKQRYKESFGENIHL